MTNIFKEKGVASQAWFLREIKASPNAKGFSFLSSKYLGKEGVADDVAKAGIEYLETARFIRATGKQDAETLLNAHELTSIGHRYLEEHKQDLEEEESKRPKAYTCVMSSSGEIKFFCEGEPIDESRVPFGMLSRLKKEAQDGINAVKNMEADKAKPRPIINAPDSGPYRVTLSSGKNRAAAPLYFKGKQRVRLADIPSEYHAALSADLQRQRDERAKFAKAVGVNPRGTIIVDPKGQVEVFDDDVETEEDLGDELERLAKETDEPKKGDFAAMLEEHAADVRRTTYGNLRGLISEAILAKYGDKMTVNELLEYMEETQS